jgi:AraC-like DNA-binding protein
MTTLRIAEAKRVILAHPDWNNETVAQHCGFTDRSYFQRIFKKYVGITPSDFAR